MAERQRQATQQLDDTKAILAQATTSREQRVKVKDDIAQMEEDQAFQDDKLARATHENLRLQSEVLKLRSQLHIMRVVSQPIDSPHRYLMRSAKNATYTKRRHSPIPVATDSAHTA